MDEKVENASKEISLLLDWNRKVFQDHNIQNSLIKSVLTEVAKLKKVANLKLIS